MHLHFISQVNDLVRSGSDFGGYDGTGITSALATSRRAIRKCCDGNWGSSERRRREQAIRVPHFGVHPATSVLFGSGYNPTQYDTLVMYTYLGDSFLRGTVDGNDTFQAFANLGTTPTLNTWGNGDYYYQATSGTPVNGNDTFQAFASAGYVRSGAYPLTISTSDSLSGVAVPEPGSIVLCLLAFFGCLIGRRQFRP